MAPAKGVDMIGKPVEVYVDDRKESVERGELVSLEPLGATIKYVSRGNEILMFIPMTKIISISHSSPVSK